MMGRRTTQFLRLLPQGGIADQLIVYRIHFLRKSELSLSVSGMKLNADGRSRHRKGIDARAG